jgi:hypothetical protein
LQGNQLTKDLEFPDLVVAGPGWDSDYGREVRAIIDEANRSIALTEHRTLNTEPRPGETAPRQNSAPIHAVDMLSGAAKWGALYGCEAFVLPSHQENFGIAVVEALACGKPVLISDQVNIWREIVEDGAGIAEADTEEGVEKLLRRFLAGMRQEADEELSHRLTRMDEDKSERLAAARTKGECLVPGIAYGPSTASRPPVPALGALSAESLNVQRSTLNSTMGHRARECYLKRFAIGPAAAKLAEVLSADSQNHEA